MKRLLPAFAALFAGLIVLLDFFLDNPLLDAAASFLLEGAIIIGAFAVILGLANLLWVHERRIRRREKGWPTSVIILLAALASLLVGLLTWQRPVLGWFYRYLLFPLEAGVGALLAFAVVGAAVRVWRLGTWEGAALLAVGVVVLLGSLPLDNPYFYSLAVIRDWIVSVPTLAAVRGILLGVALGVVATGLRLLLWVDRPYE